jgi:hypothetical protein
VFRSQAVWACDELGDGADGCPKILPPLGTPCTRTKSDPCAYDDRYRCVAQRACVSGKWSSNLSEGHICPVSRRAAKTRIAYVGSRAKERLARELLGLRLARYEYRDPRNGRGRKLGFLIDDAPSIPAVDASGERIDLYAYASMAVAALQSQAKQIDALRREITSLREGTRRRTRRTKKGSTVLG